MGWSITLHVGLQLIPLFSFSDTGNWITFYLTRKGIRQQIRLLFDWQNLEQTFTETSFLVSDVLRQVLFSCSCIPALDGHDRWQQNHSNHSQRNQKVCLKKCAGVTASPWPISWIPENNARNTGSSGTLSGAPNSERTSQSSCQAAKNGHKFYHQANYIIEAKLLVGMCIGLYMSQPWLRGSTRRSDTRRKSRRDDAARTKHTQMHVESIKWLIMALILLDTIYDIMSRASPDNGLMMSSIGVM